ncbi:MAG: hypothetical protein FWD37_06475, partial [Methanomassiliicoccaceae archaeon]|nr:hypothetical protein [Methanomassiliicoccaceae archaeon]
EIVKDSTENAPDYEIPELSPIVYDPTKKIGSIDLPKGWTWVNGDEIPKVIKGKYLATFTSDDENYDPITVELELTVLPATVIIPSLDESSFVHTGSSITPVYTLNSLFNVSGDVTKTNVGNYEIIFALADADNYVWSNGNNYDITLDWEITAPDLVSIILPVCALGSHFEYRVNNEGSWKSCSEGIQVLRDSFVQLNPVPVQGHMIVWGDLSIIDQNGMMSFIAEEDTTINAKWSPIYYDLKLPLSGKGFKVDHDFTGDMSSVPWGTEIRFTVNYEHGYVNALVKANSTKLNAVLGVYTITVFGDTVVDITAEDDNLHVGWMSTGTSFMIYAIVILIGILILTSYFLFTRDEKE